MFTHPLRSLMLSVSLVAGLALACTPTPDTSGEGSATGGTGGSKSSGGSGGGAPSTGGSGGGSTPTTGGAGGGGSTTGGTGGGSSSTGGTGGGSEATGGTGGGAGGAAGGSGGTNAGTGGSADTSSPPADTSGAGGNAGAGGFPPGPHKVVFIVGDDNNLNDPSRVEMLAILNSMKTSHNLVVEEVKAAMVRAANMMDKALLIASPNANYFGVTPEPALKNLAVPLIVSKDGDTSEFGLGRTGNTDPNQDSISIIKADHPLAAGLPVGNVKVMTTANRQRMVQFTNLGPGAIKIATIVGNANQFCLFGYEKGADMGAGLKAPAKRVGFFWHRPAGPTAEGKKLFQAAVEWAIKP